MISSNQEPLETSPLDQIRQAEAEVTRQVVAARRAAQEQENDVRRKISSLKSEARLQGEQEGKVEYRQRVTEAREEAQVLVSEARKRAQDLRRRGDQWMAVAVRRAIEIVLGEEQGPDEP